MDIIFVLLAFFAIWAVCITVATLCMSIFLWWLMSSDHVLPHQKHVSTTICSTRKETSHVESQNEKGEKNEPNAEIFEVALAGVNPI